VTPNEQNTAPHNDYQIASLQPAPESQTSRHSRETLIFVIVSIVVVLLLCCCASAGIGFVLLSNGNSDEIDTKHLEFTPQEYESWARGCSAILASRFPGYDPHEFGMVVQNERTAEDIREMLSRDWGVDSRRDLVSTIERMTDTGHNARFIEAYKLVSRENFDSSANDLFGDEGHYMWPLTKSIGDKWGGRHIQAWDWFRMIHLASWGYSADYLEREEAYALMTPVIKLLRSEFTSWDEANDNYMDGFAWWSRTDLKDFNSEYYLRRDIYSAIADDPTLFDSSVWTTRDAESSQKPSSEDGDPAFLLANAPRYSFGNNEFVLFDGKPGSQSMGEISWIEFYHDFIPLQKSASEYTLEEAQETGDGGELFGLLSSSLIAAENFEVERRAAVVDGKQYPWTLLYIWVYYPEAKNDSQEAENMAKYEQDIVTIFVNCDPYFIDNGYNIVCISGHWNGGMQILTGYGKDKTGTTFLDDFR